MRTKAEDARLDVARAACSRLREQIQDATEPEQRAAFGSQLRYWSEVKRQLESIPSVEGGE